VYLRLIAFQEHFVGGIELQIVCNEISNNGCDSMEMYFAEDAVIRGQLFSRSTL
jgi:hypothetical protein